MLQRLRAGPGALARWAPSIVVGLVVCAGPLWLWGVPLRGFFLKGDDFVYIARSRTPAALREYLLRPHNGHVVPLFRLETHALARLAGSLEAMPTMLCWASYATLVVAMATAGHVVARETGRTAVGLAAMAAVGLTSVLGPTLLWYSAGQALGAGVMVLIMLAGMQAWMIRGGWWRLALSLLAAVAAPLIWSGGYAAGPVGMAYLWADGRRTGRRAAWLVAVTSLATIAVVWSVAGRGFAPAFHAANGPAGPAPAVPAMIAHTAQAVCEALILNNLGLDATTTDGQAMVFCGLLAALWAWSRRRFGRSGARGWPHPNPLEASGAALVVTTFGLIFAARGTESDFDSLRGLGWYDAMAELGAVLFVAGWFAGDLPTRPPAVPALMGRREFLGVALFAAVVLAVQAPRADRVIFEYDEMAAPIGPAAAGAGVLRTPGDLAARARVQREALASLDRMEAAAQRGEIDRGAIRRSIDAVAIPGMPTHLLDFDPTDLLDIPRDPMHLHGPGEGPR